MSDKPLYSLGKAIREVVESGTLTGPERTAHFELERAAESGEFGRLRGGNLRDTRLYAPLELFTRQLTVSGFPIGVEVFSASNLLT